MALLISSISFTKFEAISKTEAKISVVTIIAKLSSIDNKKVISKWRSFYF